MAVCSDPDAESVRVASRSQQRGEDDAEVFVERDVAAVEGAVVEGAPGEAVAGVGAAVDVFAPREDVAGVEQLRQRGAAARAVGVHRDTVREHRTRFPEFAAAVSGAETEADEAVENALYKSAVEDRNVTAIQVWLYNRCSDRWQDRRNLNLSGKVASGAGVTDEQIDAELQRLIENRETAAKLNGRRESA